jgi:tetratricopeptide (TPR) repeat protein
MAVNKINVGKVDEAEKILDSVIYSYPKELGARVARGTARALKRDLEGSVEDFSAAIEIEPRYYDTYKRRGQARSALGQQTEALADLKKAYDLIGTMGQGDVAAKADCLLERGMIYQRQKDYRRACVEVKEAVKLDPTSFMAWNVLGLCIMSQGDIMEGIAGYKKALELKPDLKDAWLNMAQAYKEAGNSEESEKAFAKLLALDDPANPNLNAMRVISQMRQQKGDHFGAIQILDEALSHKKEELAIELLYQRGVCYHALGYMREAVRDYEECMSVNKPDASEETRSFQYLAFYQKEMALYLYSNYDKKTHEYCLDCEIQPLFKELWAKKGPPTAELIAQYTPQPLLPMSPPLPPPRVDTEALTRLCVYADRLGDLLQNNHQGFMYNTRLQRAAGFAAIELAQTMRGVIADRKAGNQTWVVSEGSSVHRGASGRHLFGWRDAMDIVVKWRQLAEPNDQVIWVDLLTRREFEQGFGSHTPMFTGQTKVIFFLFFS